MYTRKVNFTEVNTYGGNLDKGEDDVYTVEAFKEYVACGAFIDYDGYGHPVKDGLADSSIDIHPSKIHKIPPDATHIIWFNR